MSQDANNTTKIPANAPKLADRVKKLNDSVRMFIYKERGEEKAEKEITEVEHQGRIVGRFVTMDGEVTESHASHDAQESGIHEKAAKAVGQKSEDITKTSPTEASHDAADKAKKDERQKDVRESESVKIASGSEKEVKPKDPKESKKPDNSMSAMASMESAETQGAPDLTKSNVSVAVKMAKMAKMCSGKLKKAYDIKAEPGKITYTKVTPEQQEGKPNVDTTKPPAWKVKWNAKSPQERQEFRAKLSAMRGPGKGLVKTEHQPHPGPSVPDWAKKVYDTPEVHDKDKKKDLNKSVYQKMLQMTSSLKKNAVAGYPNMGIAPTIPMAMSKENENEISKTSDVSGYKPPKPRPDLANARSGTSVRSPGQEHLKTAQKHLGNAVKTLKAMNKGVLV